MSAKSNIKADENPQKLVKTDKWLQLKARWKSSYTDVNSPIRVEPSRPAPKTPSKRHPS